MLQHDALTKRQSIAQSIIAGLIRRIQLGQAALIVGELYFVLDEAHSQLKMQAGMRIGGKGNDAAELHLPMAAPHVTADQVQHTVLVDRRTAWADHIAKQIGLFHLPAEERPQGAADGPLGGEFIPGSDGYAVEITKTHFQIIHWRLKAKIEVHGKDRFIGGASGAVARRIILRMEHGGRYQEEQEAEVLWHLANLLIPWASVAHGDLFTAAAGKIPNDAGFGRCFLQLVEDGRKCFRCNGNQESAIGLRIVEDTE